MWIHISPFQWAADTYVSSVGNCIVTAASAVHNALFRILFGMVVCWTSPHNRRSFGKFYFRCLIMCVRFPVREAVRRWMVLPWVKNCEDSLAVLKSLQEIMHDNADKLASLTNEETAETKMRNLQGELYLAGSLVPFRSLIHFLYVDCMEYLAKYRHWKHKDHNENNHAKEEFYVPSQAFLTALIQIF